MTSEELAQLLSSGVSGADLGALGAFQQGVAAESPYRMAAAPILGAKFDMGTWSPGARFGVSAGQAFLGSLLGEIAKRNESEQLSKVTAVLPQMYRNPEAVSAPSGVDANAFEILRQNIGAKRAIGEAAQASKITDDLLKVSNAGAEAKAKKIGEIQGTKEAYGMSQDPDSPQAKTADQLRREFFGTKAIADFADVKNKVLVLQKAQLDPSSVADLDYVYAVAKILDPGSVVRESEGRTIIESNSIPGSTLGYLNKALNAETAIDRKNLMGLAMRHYETRAASVGDLVDRYSGLMQKRGADPADLTFSRADLELPKELSAESPNSGGTGTGLADQLKAILSEMKDPKTSQERKVQLRDIAEKLSQPVTSSSGVPIG